LSYILPPRRRYLVCTIDHRLFGQVFLEIGNGVETLHTLPRPTESKAAIGDGFRLHLPASTGECPNCVLFDTPSGTAGLPITI
jgi:hypothetical protein